MLKDGQKWEERQSSEPDTLDRNLRPVHNVQRQWQIFLRFKKKSATISSQAKQTVSSTLIFIYMLLLAERQAGEACELLKK